MVRGNWQKRVELAEARRRDTKNRKQKQENKRSYKTWVYDFCKQLDQHQMVIRKRQMKMHLWTETLTSTSPPLLDLLEEHLSSSSSSSPNKRRPRTSSIESEGSAGGGGSSRRSSGTPGSGSKKKVHPRSKEANHQQHHHHNLGSTGAAEDGVTALVAGPSEVMCRRHFLFGKCHASSSSSCKYFHYNSKKYLNLASVVPTKNEVMDQVEAAILAGESGGDYTGESSSQYEPGTMDMLFYTALVLSEPRQEGQATTTTLPSEDVIAQLGKLEIPLASIVYVAVGNILVFDRNQQGTLSQGMDSLNALASSSLSSSLLIRQRNSSVGSEADLASATDLPGAVLELMLTYLPDTAVAACCQVCRSWHREIGQHSPNLWKHLLLRRSWPVPPLSETPAASLSVQAQLLFQKHYVALRNVRALASAVPSITLSASAADLEEKEVTFQSFASRKHAPQAFDTCVALQQWSPNHVLAAYANECTLRLFQAVPFRGSEKRCKELVCQSVDPYRSTKKRTCTLDAVGLDEDMIACLLVVSATTLDSPSSAFILVVLSRDDFLLGESSAQQAKGGGSHGLEEQQLQVIDVGEALLNYMLSSDVVDHRMLPLFDYLSAGGAVGDIVTSVSRHNICACGYGRFLLEISISIPSEDQDDRDDDVHDATMQLLDRKLVMFSAVASAIVWMGDAYPSPSTPLAADIPAVLASIRLAPAGGSRRVCTIATGYTLSPTLMSCDIEPSGLVQVPAVVESSQVVRGSLVTQQQGFQAFPSPCLLVSESDIIAKDTIYRTNDQGEYCSFKSTLTFFKRGHDYEQVPEGDPLRAKDELPGAASPLTNHTVLALAGEIRIHDMVCHSGDYVIVIGTELLEGRSATLIMLVVHIPTRTEIGRIPFASGSNDVYDSLNPRLSNMSDGTLSLALGGFGLAMTGSEVRSLFGGHGSFDLWEDKASLNNKNQKKKKPARAKKGSKKDGFARGMSLRG